MSETRTGIQVTVKHSAAVRALGEALHFLHLDAINKALATVGSLVIELDGVETSNPWAGPHVVECSAGPHALSVWFHGWGPMAKSAGPAFTAADLSVTVEAGRLTQVVYEIHSSPNDPPTLYLQPG